MAKQPAFLGLDRFDITPRNEVIGASLDLLLNAEARQHAIMTKHGGAPYFLDIVIVATGGTSVIVPAWIPPGVLYCDLALCLFGMGNVTATCAADATGTKLTTRGDTAVAMAELGEWVGTSGILSDSLGAESGRAIQVASAVSWAWQQVDITLTISHVTTRCGIVGGLLTPIHQAV